MICPLHNCDFLHTQFMVRQSVTTTSLESEVEVDPKFTESIPKDQEQWLRCRSDLVLSFG